MKKERLSLILDIIGSRVISTQEELQDALAEKGCVITQATVSRDIKELSLTKGKDSNGVYRYLAPARTAGKEPAYLNVFQSSCLSVEYAVNDVVIKCHTGMANAACAVLDQMPLPGIVGTLAGDDTVLIITRNESAAELIAGQIRTVLNR